MRVKPFSFFFLSFCNMLNPPFHMCVMSRIGANQILVPKNLLVSGSPPPLVKSFLDFSAPMPAIEQEPYHPPTLFIVLCVIACYHLILLDKIKCSLPLAGPCRFQDHQLFSRVICENHKFFLILRSHSDSLSSILLFAGRCLQTAKKLTGFLCFNVKFF